MQPFTTLAHILKRLNAQDHQLLKQTSLLEDLARAQNNK